MLTKSKFRNFKDCRNEFWLDHHFPPLPEEETLDYQLRRETGYQIESLARTLPIFAARDGFVVEFGKVFQTDNMYAKADIVVSESGSNRVAIYEVKSGTSVKEEYQLDLAFQCAAAKAAGFEVTGAYLIVVDNSYVFDGTINSEQLLKISDELENIAELIATVPVEVADALAFLAQPEPVAKLTDYCKTNKLNCRFILRHFPDIPEYNVSNLFKSGSKKLDALLEAGILNISDIPNDFKLTDREQRVVDFERAGVVAINRKEIGEVLSGLQYPLNFLDYETFNPAIPMFVGTKPYQQVVFQYSLHTIAEPGAEPVHSAHLSRNDGRHPVEEVIERLRENLDGRIGSIVVWNATFEATRHKDMALMYPQHAEFFEAVNSSMFDLATIFGKHLYMHPDFRGSSSIKNVLPVLCPELTYKGMDIADGLTASISWYHMATGRGTAEDREKIYRDLIEYCHLDTLAMVRIYQHLLTI